MTIFNNFKIGIKYTQSTIPTWKCKCENNFSKVLSEPAGRQTSTLQERTLFYLFLGIFPSVMDT